MVSPSALLKITCLGVTSEAEGKSLGKACLAIMSRPSAVTT